MKKAYIALTGGIFGLIAILHILRLVNRWPVDIAGHTMPVWLSGFGLAFSGLLSLWALRMLRE